jgi:hypothetical protein
MNRRDTRRALGSAAATVAWVALLAATPARAQFPDVSSENECPGCGAALEALEAPRLAGVWSSPLTSADDPAWAREDFACFIACTPADRARAAAALPRDAGSEHAAYPLFQFACDPRGFAEQVVSPLPLQIEVLPGRVVLHYEEFGATRTIALGARSAAVAGEPTLLGTSSARIDNGALVVETHGIAARRVYAWFGGRAPSEQLRATERYAASADGAWLELTLELVDPQALSAPLVLVKRWRRVPGVEIAHYGCDVMSGQLEGVFAEYVDPARVDERRAGASSARLTAISPSDERR